MPSNADLGAKRIAASARPERPEPPFQWLLSPEKPRARNRIWDCLWAVRQASPRRQKEFFYPVESVKNIINEHNLKDNLSQTLAKPVASRQNSPDLSRVP